MKAHPEIKWSEILRQAIIDYLKKIEEPHLMTVKELKEQLDKETLHRISNLDTDKEIEFYQKIKKEEKERIKHLIELERS